jgi:hypothetical protein
LRYPCAIRGRCVEIGGAGGITPNHFALLAAVEIEELSWIANAQTLPTPLTAASRMDNALLWEAQGKALGNLFTLVGVL